MGIPSARGGKTLQRQTLVTSHVGDSPRPRAASLTEEEKGGELRTTAVGQVMLHWMAFRTAFSSEVRIQLCADAGPEIP